MISELKFELKKLRQIFVFVFRPKIYPPTSIVVGGGQQTGFQPPTNPFMELTSLANRRL